MVLYWYYGDNLKQIKFYVSDEEYEKLKKLAAEVGLSVPMLTKQAVFEKFNLGGSSATSLGRLGELEERVKLLEKKYEQLGIEVGRIERDLFRIIVKMKHMERMLRHSRLLLPEQARTQAIEVGQRDEEKGRS